MKKIIIIFIGISLAIMALIVFAGMYKFNYLANQPGYDVDGNKMETVHSVPTGEEVFAVCSDGGLRFLSEAAALANGLSYAQFGATYCPEYKTIVHPTWDLDGDTLIDCGFETPCDYSVDYSASRTDVPVADTI